MDYKELNEVTKDLRSFTNYNNPISTSENENEADSYGEIIQGSEGSIVSVYRLDSGLHIQITTNTDSYGDDIGITGFQIVEPTEVTITEFKSV